MNRIVTAALVIAGALAGAAGTLYWQTAQRTGHGDTQGRKDPAPRLIQTIPKLGDSQVANHRREHFSNLRSINDIEQLPTTFAKNEALHAIAGRAQIEALQDYARQAQLLPNRYRRTQSLNVLFQRYAKLNADGALAFLTSLDLDIAETIIDTLFRAWGEIDLDAALMAANGVKDDLLRKAAGHALLHMCAETRPEQLDAVAARLVDHHDLKHIRTDIIGIQATFSPEAAIEAALVLGKVSDQIHALQRTGYVWARTAPAAAFAYGQFLTNARLRKEYLQAVVGRWVTTGPVPALDAIQALENPVERETMSAAAMRSLASIDPQQALRMVTHLDTALRDTAYRALFESWASSDPKTAAIEAARLPTSTFKASLLSKVAVKFAGAYPEQAIEWAESLKASNIEGPWRQVLWTLASDQPQLALAAARRAKPSNANRQVVKEILRRLASSDPATAAQLLLQIPAEGIDRQAYSAVSYEWASRNPEAALNWVLTLEGEAYQTAAQTIGTVLIQRDPDAAVAFLDRITGPARTSWLQGIAAAYGRDDPNRALEWIKQFEGEEGYRLALPSIALGVSRKNPVNAMRLAQNVKGDERPGTIRNIMMQWAQEDPVTAAAWLETADLPTRVAATPALATHWMRTDREVASRWLDGLPAGATRDRAIAAVVGSTISPGENELRLLRSIDARQLRDAAIGQIAARMYGYDRKGALAFMNQADMSPEMRDKLVTNLEEMLGRASE